LSLGQSTLPVDTIIFPKIIKWTYNIYELFLTKEIKEAIISLHGGNCPLEELIAVAEATFKFIHHADMDTDQKNAFFHLQRLFDFYKNLLRAKKKKIIIVNKD